MLQVINVEKNYGDRTLFKDVSFSLTPGERLALVGRNGTGKSTLFRMILGDEHPDQGEIVIPKGYRIGHLSQHLHFTAPNILAEACRGLPEGCEGEEYKGEIILSGLGFAPSDFERPASLFSGGFQIRVELARVLLSQPNLLLLDEPTNYLDIVSARWLEHFLRDWETEMIVISHDRTFLDAVCTHTMIINRGSARRVSGGTGKLYELIAQDETIYEQTRLNQEKKRRDMEEFINRFKAKAGTASLAQSRAKMLEKMEIGEELREEPVLDFSFTSAPFHGRALLEVEGVDFTYPASPQHQHPQPILKDFSLVISPQDRIGVIGKNGKGKSTLLRLLAGDLKANSGEVRTPPAAAIGYFGQTNIQRLSERLTIEEEISHSNPKLHKTRVRGICGTMMFSGDDAEKKIKILSGGEKSRVLLGKMLALPTNLLLLDEPTNHLDVESIAALVDSLEQYEGAVVLVTHDEFMLRKLAKRLVLFSDDGVEVIEGDYDYFMDTRGWGDEDDLTPTRRKVERTPHAGGNDRKARAKARQAKNDLLKPLDDAIAKAEAKIVEQERRVSECEKAMLDPANSRNGQRLGELSREAKKARESIEALFLDLERLTKERQAAAGDDSQ